MKQSVSILGFITCILLSSGLLFKMMHWPSANILIGLSLLILNFGLLPVLFFGKRNSAKI